MHKSSFNGSQYSQLILSHLTKYCYDLACVH
jgi:hypothetical protein